MTERGKQPVAFKIFLLCFGLWAMGETSGAMNQLGTKGSPPWVGKYQILVIAHRGFSGNAPENTLTSFKRAMEAGSDVIELDVHLSKEGEVVVIHDDTLDRTTNGKGKVVDYTLKELKQFDAGLWFGNQFSGEKIPTLEEVLGLARGRIRINIELKREGLGNYSVGDLANQALQEVQKMGMEEQVLFSSFDPSPLKRMREDHPRIQVAFLYNKDWNSPEEILGGSSFSILTCRKSVLNSSNISKAHQEGIKVNVYTLNTEEEMQQFLKIGVDGIITDYPDRLINVLQKR